MNLNFSDEQVMLRDQLQKFCEAEYDFYKREEILKSNKDFDENVWSLFAEQGWLSIPFSEESGGFGFGPIETSILFEDCLLYTSPSPRDRTRSRMPSSA